MGAIEDKDILAVGGLLMDASTQRLTVDGQIVVLRPKSWNLLSYMAARPGLLLTKKELIEAVWADRVVTEASLNQAVRELRKALGDDARSPRYIETVHRLGFRFIADTGEQATASLPQETQFTAADQGKAELFGRQQALDYLRAQFKQATNGQRQLCFVTGEPGIGKTSLVQAFLDSVSSGQKSNKPAIGMGQCIDQHGEGEAYLPILEALDRLARGPNGERVQQQLQRYAPTWLIQLPWLLPPDGPDYDPLLASATPTRMLREFCVLCEAIAAESPLILWLEDLHWSDHSTIGLLNALAHRHEASSIFVIASYRPVDAALIDAPVRQLKQALVQHNSASELPLELLNTEEVNGYLAERFGGLKQLTALTEVIYEATDGNPLFLVTLSNYLVTQQLLVRDECLWTLAEPVESISRKCPESLRGIIEQHLQHTTDEEHLLLETASVVGNSFSARAVANILACDTGAVELTCQKLTERSRLLMTLDTVEWPDNSVSQGYTFTHDIFRRTLYDSLSPARVQQLHLLAGEVLEKAYRGEEEAVAAELALHFEIGRDSVRAIHYLQIAAHRAQQLGPASEAARYFERAVVQSASQPPSTEALSVELNLRLSLLKGMGYSWGGYTAAKKQANLQQALLLCEELHDDANKALLLSLQIGSQVLAGDMSGAAQTRSRYHAVAENLDDRALLSLEPMWSGVRALVLGKLHSAEKHFKRSIELLADENLREPFQLFGFDPAVASLGYATIPAWLLGFPDEARHRARLGQIRAEAIGAPLPLVNGLDMALNVEHFQGELEAARPLAKALDALLEEFGVEYNFSRPMAARNWILLNSGDPRAAIAGITRDIGEARKTGHGIFLSLMYNTLAQACLAAGSASEGLDAIEQALQIAQDGQRVLEAESWRLKGELLRAGDEDDQAEQCFRTAMQVASEQSALALELRTANSLGRLSRDTGRAQDAGEYLEKTLARFTEGFETADFLEGELILENLLSPGTPAP